MTRDTYEEVTDRIVAALESGRVPWRRPWRAEVGQPRSLDGRPYRGINALLLGMSDYSDPRWGTFAGVKRHGGNVRKGERSTIVVLWKPIKVKDPDADGGKRDALMLRYFRVFNAEQCDGLALPELDRGDELAPDLISDTAATVHANYADGPILFHGGRSAFYRPSDDAVHMPDVERFESTARYATTLFHELVHSTGHASRLNRAELMESNGFGSKPYSKEELTAEIGAGMVAASVGIDPDYPQSAAYIASWLTALRNDKRLIISAAARAQKAADWILNAAAGVEAES